MAAVCRPLMPPVGNPINERNLKDVHFRVFYRNIEGGIGFLERKITYNFDQQEDGSWDVAYWDKKGGWGSAQTQDHIDALMDF